MGEEPLKVLITGAAGGLGSALARRYARGGARLALLDHRTSALNELHDALAAEHEAPLLAPVDLAAITPDQVDELVENLEQEWGGLDLLIHAAAHFEGLQPMQQVPPQEWLTSLQVNLNAPWLLSTRCLPLLADGDGGWVVFLLDEAATEDGVFWGPYGAAKSALRALVEAWGRELQGQPCGVVGVCPGPMDTALRARAWAAEPGAAPPPPEQSAGEIVAALDEGAWRNGQVIRL